MNLYALFRLLWCPVKILTPLGFVLIAAFVAPAQMILNTDEPGRVGALAALLFPALAGFVIGQAVGELESCSFSWTLPGLHRGLLSSVMLTGVVGALAAVGFHIALGGSYGPAIFGLAALGFSSDSAWPRYGDPVRYGRSLGSVRCFLSAPFGCDCTDLHFHRSDRSTLPGPPDPLVHRWGYGFGVVSMATL